MLPTLLIVDDERATREGLRSALEEDFDVYLASNNSEALAILKSEEIQLLLTDLRLGGDSGMDLIDTAAKLPAPPMILMMTAYGSVDTAVEAMRRGAFHFVTKPLNLASTRVGIAHPPTPQSPQWPDILAEYRL
jgi:two-component system, NtrC family, response regulator AtoC